MEHMPQHHPEVPRREDDELPPELLAQGELDAEGRLEGDDDQDIREVTEGPRKFDPDTLH